VPPLVPVRPKTVAILTSGLAFGGAERQLANLALGLHRREWSVQVLSMMAPTAFIDEFDRDRIPWTTLRMAQGVPDPRALIKTIKWLRASKPQALLTFNYPADVLGRIAGAFAGVPIVIGSLRSLHFGGPHRDLLLRLSDPLVNLNVANSRLVAQSLCARGVVRPTRVAVIPNGISTVTFTVPHARRTKAREGLPVPSGVFCWMAIGRLDAPKDYPNLLQAFSMIHHDGAKPHLCIAGAGSQDALLRLASQLGLGGRIHFLGLRRDVPDLLSAADAFVLSSAWEGLPNVVMEAMASGLPVVVTDVGGVRELVQDDVSGYVVAPRSSQSLASAMHKMMAMPLGARQRMGAAGQDYVQRHFEMERVLDAWEAQLSRLADWQ
jgi:glycosyltransferase involved in cell wall biosynthesis